MPKTPFKRGDWVIYVGRSPRFFDPSHIGSIYRVRRSITNLIECDVIPYLAAGEHPYDTISVYSDNIELWEGEVIGPLEPADKLDVLPDSRADK
jgi:hypothetical protein